LLAGDVVDVVLGPPVFDEVEGVFGAAEFVEFLGDVDVGLEDGYDVGSSSEGFDGFFAHPVLVVGGHVGVAADDDDSFGEVVVFIADFEVVRVFHVLFLRGGQLALEDCGTDFRSGFWVEIHGYGFVFPGVFLVRCY
jgi:hypothetical protein